MRRFECHDEGAAKFWEVSVEGAELTVTFGRLGTSGQTKTKSFESEGAAEKEAAKLIREKTSKGYAEVAAEVAAEIATKAEAPPAVAKPKPSGSADLFGIPARKLEGVAAKIAKAKRRSDVHDLLHRAGVARPDCAAATWHIAAKGLAPVGGPLLEALEATPPEDGPTALSFDDVEAVLRRVVARPSVPHERANWLVAVLELARRAIGFDADRAAALAGSLPDAVRGAFVIARPRARTDDELSLALAQITGPSGEFAFDNGVALLDELLSVVPLARLEWVLAPREAWAPDLLSVRDEVPRWLLARRDSAEDLFALADRFRARAVKPVNQGLERSFEAAAMAIGMQRLAQAGAPIPAGLEASVPWSGDPSLSAQQRTFNARTTQPALSVGLAALTRERALALVGDDLLQSLLVLAVHPDEAALGARLGQLDDVHSVHLLAGHDADAMLRALRAILDRTDDAEARRSVRIAACAVLDAQHRRELDLQHRSRGSYVARTEAPLESVDALLTTASRMEGAWSASAIEAVFRRLPAARRDAVVLRMLGEGEAVERLLALTSYLSDPTLVSVLEAALAAPERVDWAAVQRVRGHAAIQRVLPGVLRAHRGALGAEVAAALGVTAAPDESALARLVRWSKDHAAGPTRRVYAVNRRDGEPTASRVEGPGPAIDRAAHGIPDDAVHALTLDLTEVPELAARFPGMRLFSVYAPDPAAGDWDEGWVVTSPALPDAPQGDETPASPLELTPIDVPAALLASEELRTLLLAQHGWVLGAPSWIQDPVGSDEGFVMQFGGRLGRDFGTADEGEVFVFADHVFLQSH